MKFFKNIITVVIIISMIVANVYCVIGADQTFSFADDFSYDQAGGTNVKGQTFAQNWQNSSANNGKGYMSSGIIADPDNGQNKVMQVNPGNNWASGVNLMANHSGIGSSKVVQVDIRGIWTPSNGNQRYGLGVMQTTGANELNCVYQLYCVGGVCTFLKYDAATATYIPLSSTSNVTDMNKWYTFKLILNGAQISWSITAKDGNYSWSDSWTDPSPLNVSEIQLFAGGQDNPPAQFDNFVYRTFEPYVDGEPGNVIYLNTAFYRQAIAATEAASGSSVENAADGDISTKYITNGTGIQQYAVDLGQPYDVRRLQILGLGSNTANLGNNLYIQASNDASFSEPIDLTQLNASLINNDNFDWVNTVEFSPYRYVRLIRKDSSDSFGFGEFRVLTDVDENDTTNILTRSKAEYFLRMNKQDNTGTAIWTSSIPDIASVSGGVVSGVTAGTAIITASLNNTALTTKVQVIGEIALAQQNGTVQQYVESKRPIIEAINNAVTTKDSASLQTIIFGTISPSLTQILDFNYDKIKDFNQNQIDGLVGRILTYQPFRQSNGMISLESIENLIRSLNIEIAVGELDNIDDATTINELLLKNNNYYSLNLEDEYYLKYKDIALALFKNRTFKNVSDLKECFIKAYIMPAFKDTISYKMMEGIIEDIKTETDIDFSHYDNITDKDTFYKYLIENKSSINTFEDIISYTNNYTPAPTPTPKPVKSSKGGDSGSSIRIDPIPEQLPVIVQEESLYPDIAISDWAYEGVKFLTAKRAVKGYKNGNFEPNNDVTRAEFIQMLLVAFEIPLQTEGDAFNDVNEDDWYYQYMLSAKANKILLGDFNNNGNPNSYITRQEMATLVYRMLNTNKLVINNTNEPVMFADADEISNWAYPAVMKLQSAGVINGMEDGTFRPLGLTTRAQASKVIYQVVIKTQNSASGGEVK